MSLRLVLKPHERVIIGGAVVRNGPTRTQFHVENEVPLLREIDILSPGDADTPCRRVYLALQLMYVDPDRHEDHKHTYRELVDDVRTAAPSSDGLLAEIEDHVDAGRYYQALKRARALLHFEEELLTHGV